MQDYFETIKCDDFDVFNLDYHSKRISNTVFLNLNLQEYIYPPNDKLLKCKVIYNEEGIKEVIYDEYKKREIKVFKIISANDLTYAKKSVNRDEINDLFKQKDKADEIIILKNDLVTDTSIANIAVFDGKVWITPTITLLKGTTRDRLLEEKKLIEGNITLDMLLKSKKLALLNAMIGMDILDDYSFLL